MWNLSLVARACLAALSWICVAINSSAADSIVDRPLVETIVIWDSSGTVLGSGFAINGYDGIITAAHVVGNRTEVLLQSSFGGLSIPGIVTTADLYSDVAIIETNCTTPFTTRLEVRESHLGIGDSVRALGSLEMGSQIVTFGKISAIPTESQSENTWYVRQLLLDLAVVPGMSGGPVLDEDGLLVGMIVSRNSYSRQERTLAEAVDATSIIMILECLSRGDRLMKPILDLVSIRYNDGLLVTWAGPDTGMKPMDVIVSCSSLPISSDFDLFRASLNATSILSGQLQCTGQRRDTSIAWELPIKYESQTLLRRTRLSQVIVASEDSVTSALIEAAIEGDHWILNQVPNESHYTCMGLRSGQQVLWLWSARTGTILPSVINTDFEGWINSNTDPAESAFLLIKDPYTGDCLVPLLVQ